MFTIPQISGRTPQSDDELASDGRTIYGLFEANGNIAVGEPIKHDVTVTNASGVLVIVTAAATEDYYCRGVYSGLGGSSAESTVTDADGLWDAKDGDHIFVAMSGHQKVMVNANSVNIVAGDMLELQAGEAGRFYKDAAVAAQSSRHCARALEANASDDALCDAWIANCL